MSTKQKTDFVNRVNQLDALELDKEVFVVLKQQVIAICKSLEPSLLSRFEPEVDAILSFLIWSISVRSGGATFGHQMLKLRLSKGNRFDKLNVFWAFILIPIVIRYLRERSRDVAAKLRVSAADRNDGIEPKLATILSNTVRWAQLTIAVGELVNFLLFLRQGQYPNLVMRMLDLKIVPQDDRSGHRPVGYSYVTRELLWHSFIELLVFALPLINYHYMRRVVLGFLSWGTKFPLESGKTQPKPLTLATRCAVCSLRPILPHRMGCQHVFCYYCLKANLTADPLFNCPSCGYKSNAPDVISPA